MSGQCVVCPVIYPDGDPRLWDRRWVCEACRQHLHRDLSELHAQTDMLDLKPGRGRGQRVSGTRSAPLPVKEASANLLGPGNAHISEPKFEYDALGRKRPLVKPYGDQIGELPVPVWLSEWSMWWGGLWRLEWACDEDAGIADFAAELRDMLNTVRGANKDTDQRPVYKHGIPCKRCDTKALSQAGGEHDYIACGACGLLYTPAEYEQWTKMLSAWVKKNPPDTPNVA